MWRACRPPGTEFHITPPNWSFKSDFQSLMNIIAEFLHLTRGHNKGPKDPRGKSCLFSMPSHKQKESPSTHESESMGFTVDIQIGVLFSVLLLQICGHAAEEVFCAFSLKLQVTVCRNCPVFAGVSITGSNVEELTYVVFGD